MAFPNIVVLLLEGLMGLFMAYTAYTLFAWTPPMITKARDALHYLRWWWVLAGCVATLGAIGLLVGLFIPTVGVIAIMWVIAYFVVATLSHLVRKDWVNFAQPLLFLAIIAVLLWLRWADAAPLRALVGL